MVASNHIVCYNMVIRVKEEIMKNSGKKILASLALGVIGAMTLTGCSMTEDQQDALDTALTRSEELIEVLEEQNVKNDEIISKLEEQNNELQESNEKYENIIKQLEDQNIDIHKQRIAEIITENRNAWVFSDIEKIQFTRTIETYDGLFDKLNYCSNTTYVLGKENGTRICYYNESTLDENMTMYAKADFENDIYYSFSSENDEDPVFALDDGEGKSSYTMVDMFIQVGFWGDISSDEIYDVELTKNGYKFKLKNIVYYDDNDTYVEDLALYELDVEIVDDKITKVECIGFSIDETFEKKLVEDAVYFLIFMASNYEVETYKVSVTYEYENVDIKSVKDKLLEIENDYLTKE